jgi:hypothetical protein
MGREELVWCPYLAHAYLSLRVPIYRDEAISGSNPKHQIANNIKAPSTNVKNV